MTVDERIERLTERHEALTQTVELMVAENRDAANESRDAAKKTDARFAAVAESLKDLLYVARQHEARLSHLEGS